VKARCEGAGVEGFRHEQELAHKPVALDYGNGTAYAGLQMLEGAMPREAITTCAAVTQSRRAVRRADTRRLRGDRAAGALDHRGAEGRLPADDAARGERGAGNRVSSQ
jgi:hypothetical protein